MLIYMVFDIDIDENKDDTLRGILYYIYSELSHIGVPIDNTTPITAYTPGIGKKRLHSIGIEILDVMYHLDCSKDEYNLLIIHRLSIVNNRLKILMETRYE